jgi:hypothetical protein
MQKYQLAGTGMTRLYRALEASYLPIAYGIKVYIMQPQNRYPLQVIKAVKAVVLAVLRCMLGWNFTPWGLW